MCCCGCEMMDKNALYLRIHCNMWLCTCMLDQASVVILFATSLLAIASNDIGRLIVACQNHWKAVCWKTFFLPVVSYLKKIRQKISNIKSFSFASILAITCWLSMILYILTKSVHLCKRYDSAFFCFSLIL